MRKSFPAQLLLVGMILMVPEQGDAESRTVTRTAATTHADAPKGTLDPPGNVGVTGPVAISPAKLFRLGWNPVTSYTDGTPISAGSVLYTAYWTADPALSAATLRPLVSSTPGTSVTFDPAQAGMPIDQRIYFTTVATTASGEVSPLSAGIPWVALNPGPAAPRGGTITRKK